MKAKPGFILRKIVGEFMLLPIDENIRTYNGAVLLNSVSAFVWEQLQSEASREELLARMLEEFDVDEATAARDLDALREKLREIALLEE